MFRRSLCVLMVCAAGAASADFDVLVKRTTNSAGKTDPFHRLVFRPDGGGLAVGTYFTTNPNLVRPIHMRLITALGATAWTNNSSAFGDGNAEVVISDVQADKLGNAYFVGRKQGDIAVIYKYNLDLGAFIWSRTFTPAGTSGGALTSVLIEEDGITAAWSGVLTSSGRMDVRLVKWSPEGVQIGFTGPAHGGLPLYTPRGLARHEGKYFVGGGCTGPASEETAFMMRFTTNLQYETVILFPTSDRLQINSMASSGTGEFALFGSASASGPIHAQVIVYDASLTKLHDSQVLGAANSGKRFNSGAFGKIGGSLAVVCAGEAGLNATSKYGFLRVMDVAAGTEKWIYQDTPGAIGAGRSAVVDRYGDVWWAGEAFQEGQSGIFAEKILGSSGRQIGRYFENGPANQEDSVGELRIDGAGEVRMVGSLAQATGVDGAYWHFIEAPECQPDQLLTPDSTPWELDVFANDRFVNPRATFTFPNTPDHGTAAMNEDKTKVIYTPNPGYIGPDVFSYRVTRGSYSSTANVNLSVERMLIGITADRNPIAGQNRTFGRVTMSSPAGPGGDVIEIIENSSLITTPTQVSIPAGSATAAFTISVSPVTVTQTRSILARRNGITRELLLTMNPLVPTAVSFTPNPVGGGNTVSCKVVINGVAGPGGRTIAIVENSPYCTAPATVTVPAGAGSVTFNISTTTPPTQQAVTVTARVTAGEKSAVLRINP